MIEERGLRVGQGVKRGRVGVGMAILDYAFHGETERDGVSKW